MRLNTSLCLFPHHYLFWCVVSLTSPIPPPVWFLAISLIFVVGGLTLPFFTLSNTFPLYWRHAVGFLTSNLSHPAPFLNITLVCCRCGLQRVFASACPLPHHLIGLLLLGVSFWICLALTNSAYQFDRFQCFASYYWQFQCFSMLTANILYYTIDLGLHTNLRMQSSWLHELSQIFQKCKWLEMNLLRSGFSFFICKSKCYVNLNQALLSSASINMFFLWKQPSLPVLLPRFDANPRPLEGLHVLVILIKWLLSMDQYIGSE